MEIIHFKVVRKYEKCRIYTMHPEFVDKAEWNIFGIPDRELTRVMCTITEKMDKLGYKCDFSLVNKND